MSSARLRSNEGEVYAGVCWLVFCMYNSSSQKKYKKVELWISSSSSSLAYTETGLMITISHLGWAVQQQQQQQQLTRGRRRREHMFWAYKKSFS